MDNMAAKIKETSLCPVILSRDTIQAQRNYAHVQKHIAFSRGKKNVHKLAQFTYLINSEKQSRFLFRNKYSVNLKTVLFFYTDPLN